MACSPEHFSWYLEPVHSFKITFTLGSTRYCIFMPRGLYYVLLLGLPQVSDGRHTMCPNLLLVLIIHYTSRSCNPTLPRNPMIPGIKRLIDLEFPGARFIYPGSRRLDQVLISWQYFSAIHTQQADLHCT